MYFMAANVCLDVQGCLLNTHVVLCKKYRFCKDGNSFTVFATAAVLMADYSSLSIA